MADVDERAVVVLGEPRDALAHPADLARRRREQAAEDAHEARLAAAIGPGDAQPLAVSERERQFAKERPAAALAREPRRLEH